MRKESRVRELDDWDSHISAVTGGDFLKIRGLRHDGNDADSVASFGGGGSVEADSGERESRLGRLGEAELEEMGYLG